MAGLVPFNKRASSLMNVGVDDFYNMLDDFFSAGWPSQRSLSADTFKVDIQEDEGGYYVAAELPGVKREELSLSMDDGRLTIAVSRSESSEDGGKNYLHKERRFSSMQRSILLADADASGVKARLENGVLNVSIPKQVKQNTAVAIEVE
ncbi:18 kDa heat shock protein [bioreactor metagenome]|uniref:18 kDa heat shock protein n=1 Tax=bioreactor metagenome TaxID=1076179 RepID=A0A645DZ85_9ZZZZ